MQTTIFNLTSNKEKLFISKRWRIPLGTSILFTCTPCVLQCECSAKGMHNPQGVNHSGVHRNGLKMPNSNGDCKRTTVWRSDQKLLESCQVEPFFSEAKLILESIRTFSNQAREHKPKSDL